MDLIKSVLVVQYASYAVCSAYDLRTLWNWESLLDLRLHLFMEQESVRP